MEAGRELDALVAEKVMGWRNVKPYDREDSLYHGKLMGQPDPNSRAIYEVPRYSSSEDEAMRVALRIDKLDPRVANVFYDLYDGFELKELAPGQPMEPVRIDPLEICLAALKAVGHPIQPVPPPNPLE